MSPPPCGGPVLWRQAGPAEGAGLGQGQGICTGAAEEATALLSELAQEVDEKRIRLASEGIALDTHLQQLEQGLKL